MIAAKFHYMTEQELVAHVENEIREKGHHRSALDLAATIVASLTIKRKKLAKKKEVEKPKLPRIKKVSICPGNNGSVHFIALCYDDTIWMKRNNGSWSMVEALPE